MPFVLTGRPKPLATGLAGLAGEPASVAIAAQPYGLGKVLWVGTDGTWRWRYRVGDLYHHRFWGQVVRWSSGAKLAAGNAVVRFGPTRPRVFAGTAATLQAQFAEDAPGLNSGLLVAARIFRAGPDGHGAGEAVAIVPLRPNPDRPRTFEAAAPPLPRGSYRIRLDVPQLGPQAPTDEAALEVTDRDSSERIELAADRDPLDRLASLTSGRVFEDADADLLPPLLQARTLETLRTVETPLWDRPWSLVLFFAIVATEWVLRKRAGMP